jgi:hypothetical protein
MKQHVYTMWVAGPAVLIARQDVPLEYRDTNPCTKISNILGLHLHTRCIFKLAVKEFTVLSDNFVGTYEFTELVGEIPYVILVHDPFPLLSHIHDSLTMGTNTL